MQILLRWIINAGALYATVWVLQFFSQATMTAKHWSSWFIAVIIMALVNSLIRPIARVLTAPLNCLTFGLLGLVINGILFWAIGPLTEAVFGTPVFRVKPIGALIGAIMVSLISAAISQLIIKEDDRD